MLKGVNKLPINVTKDDAILIYKKLADVNRKIGRMDSMIRSSIINQSVIRLLSYNESVQSTRIEGTQVTFHEIMENKEKNSHTWEQQEVINYKNAIDFGFDEIQKNTPISTRMIKQLHKILMESGRGTNASGGEFRKVQNFIGPDKKIENATYVPIEAQEINNYMTNLEYFINGMEHPSLLAEGKEGFETLTFNSDSLLRIAVSHAQFESIHPFLDGNGRLGRILIALMAVQENIVSSPLFFVSEELEKERIRYYNSLNSTRGQNPNWLVWITYFLNASEKMADNLIEKINKSDELAIKGLEICETETQKNVWLSTFKEPIATASTLSKINDRHPATTKKALDFLVSKGLLDKDQSVKRNVKYFNYDLIRVIN